MVPFTQVYILHSVPVFWPNPVFWRSTTNTYNICKSVKIFNYICKIRSFFGGKFVKSSLKIYQIMLKIGQNVLKIWKSTSFLPKFSQCTSILTDPPPASLNVKFIYLCFFFKTMQNKELHILLYVNWDAEPWCWLHWRSAT